MAVEKTSKQIQLEIDGLRIKLAKAPTLNEQKNLEKEIATKEAELASAIA